MTNLTTDKARWPVGYRIMLRAVGVILGILLVASIFGMRVG